MSCFQHGPSATVIDASVATAVISRMESNRWVDATKGCWRPLCGADLRGAPDVIEPALVSSVVYASQVCMRCLEDDSLCHCVAHQTGSVADYMYAGISMCLGARGNMTSHS